MREYTADLPSPKVAWMSLTDMSAFIDRYSVKDLDRCIRNFGLMGKPLGIFFRGRSPFSKIGTKTLQIGSVPGRS